MPTLPSFSSLLAAALTTSVVLGANTAHAAPEVGAEDFRLFCGYLDALSDPKVQALKSDQQRDAKVAKLAKVSPKQLRDAVDRAQKLGATCEEVGKKIEADAGSAVKRALPGRVLLYVIDFDDPDHVVAAVTWTGADKKLLEEEAALLAKTLATEVPIVRTIALRGVNPLAADKEAEEATWFEAKINKGRADRIDASQIKDFADTRYIKLFDNVVRR
ncbi:MAG: hypothetical protein ACO3JL_20005 [Myxococcota bacterium]